MTEWLTIFDTTGNKIGKKLRDDVHRDGNWHETFHCWFVEKDNEDIFLYFQLRAKTKKDFPGKWDITSAGHIMHGENIGIGGLREIEEELGLSFQATDLEYKGIFKINYEIPHFIDREMCHMYFHAVSKSLPFAPGDEVEDVMKINATSFLQLLKREITSATGIPVLHKNATPISITFEDVYPYELAYYEFIVEKGRNIVHNNNF
ncbi:NUDIX hydrolase [Bacillus sp. C1]